MSKKKISVNFNNLAGGAFGEKMNLALNRVSENIQDPNTPWKNKRKITATLTFTPDEDRDIALVDIAVTESLAAPKSVGTKMVFGKDEEGKAVAGELASGRRNQFMIDDDGDVADDQGRKTDGNGIPIEESNPTGNVVSFK